MVIDHVAFDDGHQTCDCSTYLRIGLDLANTLGIVSCSATQYKLRLYFLFSVEGGLGQESFKTNYSQHSDLKKVC